MDPEELEGLGGGVGAEVEIEDAEEAVVETEGTLWALLEKAAQMLLDVAGMSLLGLVTWEDVHQDLLEEILCTLGPEHPLVEEILNLR
uniref:AS1 protein n=1 Tax=Bovine leukemia virus TaxID=11901 RepID=A0A1V1FI35_BLV|nr:AS1 protein [Bovine leukemia virus]BDT05346.1 AS1 protein [Bovine leukemia virus]BDT05474.1 AS1 protein [Bovine leukemia virus]BDT05678.1 AS1 protein [Bovine leukemia virus]BDT05686.1 AS1 protein [Bovine leukemia virus]